MVRACRLLATGGEPELPYNHIVMIQQGARGRPRKLPFPDHALSTVNSLLTVFRRRDRERGQYWEVFRHGTPKEVKSLCLHLLDQGNSLFQGQCALDQSQSLVSRILRGREHHAFPKSRPDAQQRFLARYTAIGEHIHPRTWKRAESCHEGNAAQEENNLDKIQTRN